MAAPLPCSPEDILNKRFMNNNLRPISNINSPVPPTSSESRRQQVLPLLTSRSYGFKSESRSQTMQHLDVTQGAKSMYHTTELPSNEIVETGMHTVPISDDDVEEEASTPSKQQKCTKLALLATLIIIVIYVIIDYTVPGLGFVADILTNFLQWVEDNPGLGAVAFAAVYIFTTVCFIPGSLLTLGAGLVFGRALGTGWGVLVGSVAVLVGATIGAILAFLLGRFVLREQAQGLFNKFKILKAVDRAIESQGLKLVLLLRLSPVVPFSVFNYVMGVTAVDFKSYALGCIGFIPGTVAYVFIGTTASSLLGDDDDAEEDDDGSSGNVQLIVIIVGAIATVIAVVLISIYSKRALKRVLEEGEEEENRAEHARNRHLTGVDVEGGRGRAA